MEKGYVPTINFIFNIGIIIVLWVIAYKTDSFNGYVVLFGIFSLILSFMYDYYLVMASDLGADVKGYRRLLDIFQLKEKKK